MTKARDIASAAPAPSTVSATELGYLDGVTSAIQTQIDSKSATSHNHDTAYLNQSVIDAKGDLLVGSGNDAYVRVPVGSNNQVLTADSATASGVKWATADALPSQTGNSGKYLTTNGTTASWGTVNQPITWTQRRSGDGNEVYSIAYNGSDIWVAVGAGGVLASSSNGTTWTNRTSGFGSNNIYKVAFGNGLFVAVGQNGTITTSTDGITWTARTANMGTNEIYDVIYANSLWVASGAGGGTANTGGITYSTDGLTWTRKSQSLSNIGTNYNCVNWNGTNWIIGTNHSTNNFLYASTPSGTWTVASTGSTAENINVFYDGTRTLFVDTNGTIYFSANAIPSSATQLYGANIRGSNGRYNFYYNNRIYSQGALWYSISSVPNASNQVTGIQSSLAAMTGIINTGGISTRPGAIWVGAAGLVAADYIGGIFTSF